MKNILKVIGTFIGVLILACIAGTGMTVIGIELGLERDLSVPKAECTARGGIWIVNPNSIIKHEAFGQGCSIDYAERAAR